MMKCMLKPELRQTLLMMNNQKLIHKMLLLIPQQQINQKSKKMDTMFFGLNTRGQNVMIHNNTEDNDVVIRQVCDGELACCLIDDGYETCPFHDDDKTFNEPLKGGKILQNITFSQTFHPNILPFQLPMQHLMH